MDIDCLVRCAFNMLNERRGNRVYVCLTIDNGAERARHRSPSLTSMNGGMKKVGWRRGDCTR